ncbi:MAG: cation:proton antiporter [Candidatus Melainabacteria bacterium]|nr:cation:proton antiporter [Candidatus Melainabacteria bacterium]
MDAAHHDPVVPVLLGLSIVLIAAKLGAIIADRLKQPEVLGELLAGIIVGNLILFNFDAFEFIKHDHEIAIFAELGVIILLFDVGLESNVKEMLEVGIKSFLVAIVGVVTPFLIGYYITDLIIPGLEFINRLFMGAILTATSVGITARVFKDLKFMKKEEARIVLGAAVIDDILGLIILAIVTGIAQTGQVEMGSIMGISFKAIAFVVLAVVLGVMLAHRTIKLISIFKIPGMMLTTALVLCFLGAYLANQAGLATIVGAFAIGLVLEEVHFKSFLAEYSIHDYIKPISFLLVPIFFVMTGMQVDVSVFTKPSTVIAALAITAVAILGKLICGWAFTSSSPINRMIIGMGMVPRGEVGLIFATVGKSIGVVNDELYAITVIMVILTTLIPPPILNALIKNQK